MTDEIVPVSEAARQEAAAYHDEIGWDNVAIAIREGRADERSLVQQLARFEAAIRAEYATPAAPATGGVPDGWKLVPIEVDVNMHTAYCASGPGSDETWEAMLAAAPPIPEQAPAAQRTEREALRDLIDLIEGPFGWGPIRNDRGERLKDNPRYVRAYLASKDR